MQSSVERLIWVGSLEFAVLFLLCVSVELPFNYQGFGRFPREILWNLLLYNNLLEVSIISGDEKQKFKPITHCHRELMKSVGTSWKVVHSTQRLLWNIPCQMACQRLAMGFTLVSRSILVLGLTHDVSSKSTFVFLSLFLNALRFSLAKQLMCSFYCTNFPAFEMFLICFWLCPICDSMFLLHHSR